VQSADSEKLIAELDSDVNADRLSCQGNVKISGSQQRKNVVNAMQ
jgi:hypothetical protein